MFAPSAWDGHVRGIPHERHARYPRPVIPVGELVNAAKYGCGVPVRDQRGEFGRPPIEFSYDLSLRRGGIDEVDFIEPFDRAVQHDIRVDSVADLAMRKEAFTRDERVNRPIAECFCRGRVTIVDVVQESLDVAHSGIRRYLFREQTEHFRPRSVGTQENVCINS